MEKLGHNEFRWPERNDLLLTLKEDILFKVSDLRIVGSSIRASHVGLKDREAVDADTALALVLYLQNFLFQSPIFCLLAASCGMTTEWDSDSKWESEWPFFW